MPVSSFTARDCFKVVSGPSHVIFTSVSLIKYPLSNSIYYKLLYINPCSKDLIISVVTEIENQETCVCLCNTPPMFQMDLH